MAAFTTDLTCSSSATSSAKAAALPPAAVISLTSSFSFSWLRAATATPAPSLAKRRAQVRPMPWEAPVTKATRPERDIYFLRSHSCRAFLGIVLVEWNAELYAHHSSHQITLFSRARAPAPHPHHTPNPQSARRKGQIRTSWRL